MRSNLLKLHHTQFIVVIHWVLNVKEIYISSKQLHMIYTDVRHWEELIDFIHSNARMIEPYIQTLMCKCTLEQDNLDDEYKRLYTHRKMMNEPIHGQILYNCCVLNSCKVKLGHNPKIYLVEMKKCYSEGDCRACNSTNEVNPH